jgi:hypothetical protein
VQPTSEGSGAAAPHVARVRSLARRLLPGLASDASEVVSGQFHDVVLIPDRAAIRVARHTNGYERLARTTALLGCLSDFGLPFAGPTPLTDVVELDGQAAVATSWIPGAPSPRGVGDPQELRKVLDVLAAISVDALGDVLANRTPTPAGRAGSSS